MKGPRAVLPVLGVSSKSLAGSVAVESVLHVCSSLCTKFPNLNCIVLSWRVSPSDEVLACLSCAGSQHHKIH